VTKQNRYNDERARQQKPSDMAFGMPEDREFVLSCVHKDKGNLDCEYQKYCSHNDTY
jgi:hypothetical protein